MSGSSRIAAAKLRQILIIILKKKKKERQCSGNEHHGYCSDMEADERPTYCIPSDQAEPHRPAPEVDLGLNKVSFCSTSRLLFFLFLFFKASSLDAWISITILSYCLNNVSLLPLMQRTPDLQLYGRFLMETAQCKSVLPAITLDVAEKFCARQSSSQSPHTHTHSQRQYFYSNHCRTQGFVINW